MFNISPTLYPHDNLMTEQDFLELRSMLSVAHHVPGRLRLKLDPRIREHPVAPLLASLTNGQTDTGLINARLNILARSLVLEYDSNRIDPAALNTFLTSSDMEQVRQFAETIATLFGVQLPQYKEN